MKKLVLIDSNALVHRAFHALPPLSSSKGVMTNAVYGFTSILIKMIKELEPDYIAATFDLAAPTFRHEEFAEYKIHRERAPDELYNQIPIVKEILTAMGIPIYEKAGFEADDLIGALSEKGKKSKDIQVVIATGDLDTLQLVDKDKVVVFTLRKGVTDTFLYDEKEVVNRYGLKPEQLVDYRGLKGDPSDNIPGVPGIGEKTASVLIKEFGSLDNLYDKISKQKGKKKTELKPPLTEKLVEKLLENKDQAFFSKKLSVLVKDIELDFDLDKADWRNNLNLPELENVLKNYGLFSLIKRLPEILNNGKENAPIISEDNMGKSENKIINSKEEITGVFNKIKSSKNFAFIVLGDVLSISLSEKDSFAFSLAKILADKKLKEELAAIMEDEKIAKITHDLKEMAKLFLKQGMHINNTVFDTKLAAYLINSDLRDFSLDRIYFAEFGRNPDGDLSGPAIVLELKDVLLEKINNLGLAGVLKDIELPLSCVLAEMELVGVKVDLKSVGDLSKIINKEIEKTEREIYGLAGEEFNINSPQQLSHILFDKMGLKGKVRKTGKGALSTAAAELEKLIEENPIIEFIMKQRELQKLKTTYIDPFPGFVDKKTGRLYTTFNQTGTVTGRLSSQEPNLQNIPVRTEMGQEFRKAFVADNDYSFLSFDYSQLELRIAAHISKDKKMLEAFERGEDIHTRTAAEIFNVSPDKVTPNMRREAKTLNFGVLYGMGLMGFQRAAGVSRLKAKEFIEKYMNEFSGLAEYLEETKRKAHDEGFVTTIFGRRRQLPEIYSSMPELIRQAERMAINMPIQGTAADLIKMAMIEISELLHKNYKEDDIRLLLQVHDELLFEIKNNLIKELELQLKKIMEGVYKLSIPLTVDAKIGANWSEMKKI